MILAPHPRIGIRRATIGREQAPLLVVDEFVSDAQRLVRRAASKQFVPTMRFFPGIRVPAPLSYRELIARQLRATLTEVFQVQGESLHFSMCHYSLVTTPAHELAPIQRVPHIDSVERAGLASIHYLFAGNLGGTAFYRHRSTGYECVDESRRELYFSTLQREIDGPQRPGPQYINGDTALFEQVAKEAGVFNRMLIYRRNSLHSGCIDSEFVPDPNPLTGRLSINCFFDLQ